jgi:hypothetical protein
MEARRMGADHVEFLRRWVLGVLALGLAGTVTELVLLEHYEQPLQFVPLVLIVAAVAAIAWQVIAQRCREPARGGDHHGAIRGGGLCRHCRARWRVMPSGQTGLFSPSLS